ncbi:hypothetical protein GGR57DRAFT_502437 [Xylariaceae sp. FL1272]|nr:hypothetical protein GGR57DRAFT_502437 [Xylariaceae sp. FL1272]
MGGSWRGKVPGLIKWLPPKDVLPTDPLTDQGLKHLYDHPVVIISEGAANGDVEVLMITSFSKRRLSDVFRYANKTERSRFLPIKHVTAQDECETVLELTSSKRHLARKSYVRLDRVFTIPSSWLRRYSSGKSHLRLTEESCDLIVAAMAQLKAPQQPTGFSNDGILANAPNTVEDINHEPSKAHVANTNPFAALSVDEDPEDEFEHDSIQISETTIVGADTISHFGIQEQLENTNPLSVS